MIDQEILTQLKNITKCSYDKSIENKGFNNALSIKYLITAAVIRSLVYCLEKNKIDNFETILQFDIKRSLDELEVLGNNY